MKTIKVWEPWGSTEIDWAGRVHEHRTYAQNYLCINCNGNVDKNDSFCKHCGSPLNWPVEATFIYNYETEEYDKYSGDVDAPSTS